MLRNLLSLGNNAVRRLVGVLSGTPTKLSVSLRGPGLGLGFHAPDESANVDLFSTMRAVHTNENKPNSCLCETKFKVAHYQKLIV